jgi:hypothetical protein
MNATILTTIASAVALFAALWSILANFDKRNGDRFDALAKQIEATKETLRAEFRGEFGILRADIGTVRAEMGQMRAELRTEIKEAGRIIR